MARKRPNRKGDDRRRSRPPTKRHYPRTARLNSLILQIAADFLSTVDEPDLGLVTVTGVEVDAELGKAVVYVSSLEFEVESGTGDPEADSRILETLATYRKAVQAEIARQTRLRRTPHVVFDFDPGVRAGARIEHVLASLDVENGDGEADQNLAAVDVEGNALGTGVVDIEPPSNSEGQS